MIAVVCFLWWEPQSKWRDTFTYGPHHVVTLRNMVARHLTVPHKFVCVTDGHFELPSDIETVPLDTSLITPSERYAKLTIFRPDAAEMFRAEQILMFDLDVVLVNSIDHLVNHGNDFMAWKNPRYKSNPKRRSRFNSSLVYIKAGARPEVWDRFDIATSPEVVKRSGVAGTDQGWMSLNVADRAGWDQSDGIYSFKIECRNGLPETACVSVFHGAVSPCLPEVQAKHPWVAEHYR